MKSKKPSLYDAQEEQIQLQSASFVDFLTRKGVLEDHNIDNERVRKAKGYCTESISQYRGLAEPVSSDYLGIGMHPRRTVR